MSKLRRLLTIGICIVILVVACDRSPDSSTSDRPTSASSESCRLVKHEMGETEVCGQPEQVAALSPHILDSMLALGVQPAAYAESVNLNIQTYDNPTEQIPYLGQWVTTQPIGLGDRKSPSLERLAQLQPDLILGEEWNNQDEYSLLTQIAPTLLFSDTKNPDEPQSWQQDIQGIAKALGKEAQGSELLKAFEEQIAHARKALQPVVQKYPRIFLISSNLTTHVYSQPESTTARLLKEIGFEIVQPEGTKGEAEISQEILPQIETDLIIVLSYSDDSFHDWEDTVRQKWAQNPLLKSMPVSQQGRVYFVDYYLWGSHTRGPLTDKLILESLPDLLLDSVEAEEAK
ncbi:iron-siderophore ABC transporter substrate-binding protein [Pleurocapsa sp. CCALA 161]|uniref:ABC transporter substrate-binding protein n=1 Tax=Pleurocapsa sp. CCALA 161 TaxID=2107688 RepID=UPI000D07B669|nr:iron-siderophore ABC transporter substrate-binding protein [Pleurocapsa sp. CCALA 161]PSB07465.1 iron-siderophore ABC transporter substrate-binding protein [Pleurocapsa sp. CCALA 161]